MNGFLVAPNPRYVYEAGNEFGHLFWICAESYEDAYQELLCGLNDTYVCDHGIDGEEARAEFERKLMQYPGEVCDCSLADDGRWIMAWNLTLRESDLPADKFMQAIGEEW